MSMVVLFVSGFVLCQWLCCTPVIVLCVSTCVVCHWLCCMFVVLLCASGWVLSSYVVCHYCVMSERELGKRREYIILPLVLLTVHGLHIMQLTNGVIFNARNLHAFNIKLPWLRYPKIVNCYQTSKTLHQKLKSADYCQKFKIRKITF